MGHKHRKMMKQKNRKKRGLNPDGTHHDKYANKGLGEKELRKARERKDEEIPEGNSDSFLGRTDDSFSWSGHFNRSYRSPKQTPEYRALALVDRDTETALLIGGDLPSQVNGSGRNEIDDSRGLYAILLPDVAGPEHAKGLAEQSSVRVRFVAIVGSQKGYVPSDEVRCHYADSTVEHAFRVITSSESRSDELKTRLVEDIVEKMGKNIPSNLRRRRMGEDYCGGNEGFSLWDEWP